MHRSQPLNRSRLGRKGLRTCPALDILPHMSLRAELCRLQFGPTNTGDLPPSCVHRDQCALGGRGNVQGYLKGDGCEGLRGGQRDDSGNSFASGVKNYTRRGSVCQSGIRPIDGMRTHCDPTSAREAAIRRCQRPGVRTAGEAGRTLVDSCTAPFTTRYSSGSRYLGRSSANSAAVAGAISDGLTTHAHPAAIAPACSGNRHRVQPDTHLAENTQGRMNAPGARARGRSGS